MSCVLRFTSQSVGREVDTNSSNRFRYTRPSSDYVKKTFLVCLIRIISSKLSSCRVQKFNRALVYWQVEFIWHLFSHIPPHDSTLKTFLLLHYQINTLKCNSERDFLHRSCHSANFASKTSWFDCVCPIRWLSSKPFTHLCFMYNVGIAFHDWVYVHTKEESKYI